MLINTVKHHIPKILTYFSFALTLVSFFLLYDNKTEHNIFQIISFLPVLTASYWYKLKGLVLAFTLNLLFAFISIYMDYMFLPSELARIFVLMLSALFIVRTRSKNSSDKKEIALQLAQIHTDLNKRLDRIFALESASFKDILQIIMLELMDLSDSPKGAVFLHNEITQEFDVYDSVNFEINPLINDALNQMLTSNMKNPIICNNPTHEEFNDMNLQPAAASLSRFVLVPVYNNERIEIVFCLTNKEVLYNSLDIELIKSFTLNTSVYISNLYTNESVKVEKQRFKASIKLIGKSIAVEKEKIKIINDMSYTWVYANKKIAERENAIIIGVHANIACYKKLLHNNHINQKYYNIFESSQTAMGITDSDGKILNANTAFFTSLGLKQNQYNGCLFTLFCLEKADFDKDSSSQFVQSVDFSSLKEFNNLNTEKTGTSIFTGQIYHLVEQNDDCYLWQFRDETNAGALTKEFQDSEQKYRILLESQNAQILIINSKKSITGAYGRWFETNNIDKSIIAQNHIKEFYEDNHKLFEDNFDLSLTGKSLTLEWKVKIFGKQHNLQTKFIPLWKGNSEVGEVICISNDILVNTQYESIYNDLAECMTLGICIYKRKSLVYANKTFMDIFGYENNDLKRVRIRDVLVSTVNLTNSSNPIKISRTPVTWEQRAKKKDGSVVDLKIGAVLSSYDKKPAILAYVADVTNIKTAEKELKEKNEKLRELVNVLIAGAISCDKNIDKRFFEIIDLFTASLKTTEITALIDNYYVERRKFDDRYLSNEGKIIIL